MTTAITQALVYCSLFLGIYFQTFLLLTYLSPEARRRRAQECATTYFPSVAIVVPCFNEAATIGGTVASLKALKYPTDKLEIILVNDGSTDATPHIMDQYAADPQITIIHKENGGKHTGLNMGIERTNAEFIGCLDADSFVHPKALKELMPYFDAPEIAAVTASMSVHEPKGILQRMQYVEYLIGVAFRHILATVNGLYVTPGPFSFYRRSTLQELGGFRKAYQTEDMEMALRIQHAGYRIENAPRAKVYTKAPHTVWGLLKQRTRWTSGFMRNAYDYRGLFFNRKYGILGMMVFPLAIFALVGSLTLFILTIEQFVERTFVAVAIRGEVPFTFGFQLPQLDWFFIPITTLTLLSIIAMGLVFFFLYLGKRVSGVRDTSYVHAVWYLFLYPVIAPLWVLRSTRDVLFGINRSWR
jgi:cellulose synthase/poly-beta-1,6-N-acetylglucosamine synthase-like glycosyltransferase